MSKTKILDSLNEHQQEAVKNYHGPCMLDAGPGSGKTKTIVARAAYMIAEGIDPRKILIFTFTRKAANEIKERVAEQIGDKAKNMEVGTYHSTCVKFLRRYAYATDRDINFTIYDEDDKNAALKKIIKDRRIKCAELSSKISEWKKEMIFPEEAISQADNNIEELEAQYYRDYQRRMRESNAYDFDDLILYTILLFERNPDIVEDVNCRYKYIMADEAHDSSPRDLELISYLSLHHNNLCMILDTDQSIYSFRGVDIETIISMRQRYPSMKYFVLQRNYRNSDNILKCARKLIGNNIDREEKNLYTKNDSGPKPVRIDVTDQKQEADIVTKTIMKLQAQGISLNEIAVLYRMQFMSRNIEESFLSNDIPYSITGGVAFYKRTEIKDIISYLRLIYNPLDTEAFGRSICVPKRGIGETTIDKIIELTRSSIDDSMSFKDACKNFNKKTKSFIELIEKLESFIQKHSLDNAIKYIIEEINYDKHLKEKNKESYEDRRANLQELIEVARHYNTLEEFLHSALLVESIEETNKKKEKVNLSTLHASKGLEFDAVIIIGSNEGIIPHYKAYTRNEIEEERRLFYVGMTRARDVLICTRPETVHIKGVPKVMMPSRFLSELGTGYLDSIDYTWRGDRLDKSGLQL